MPDVLHSPGQKPGLSSFFVVSTGQSQKRANPEHKIVIPLEAE
jgi:hypothetical protein